VPGSEPGARAIGDRASLATLRFGDLSDFFNPFLRHFAEETLRSGGELWVTERDGTVEGLLSGLPEFRLGTVFARGRPTTERLAAERPSWWLFADVPLGPDAEPYRLYAADAGGSPAPHRFGHLVRPVGPNDVPALVRFYDEVEGRVDRRWFDGLPSAQELGFVSEVAGTIAGAGWLSLVDGWGRLHSLAVRPRYRRLGIGGDLVAARLLRARSVGVRRVYSEIAETNGPSRAIAEAAGMRPAGTIFLSRPR
jgi:RimJ/RimL family protein N-acetyltransferase